MAEIVHILLLCPIYELKIKLFRYWYQLQLGRSEILSRSDLKLFFRSDPRSSKTTGAHFENEYIVIEA